MLDQSRDASRLVFIFLRESRFYGSGVLAKVCDAEMREFYARICPLLLINDIDVTILWAGLAKCTISEEISCS